MDTESHAVANRGTVRSSVTNETLEELVNLASHQLERIRNLVYLIERDGSTTVHVRAYAAEIEQIAHLLTRTFFFARKDQ